FLSSTSAALNVSTTRSATRSESSLLYNLGSCVVIPRGHLPVLQRLHRLYSSPKQSAAACIIYFPIATADAPSIISAAALAAKLPFLPTPPAAISGNSFCFPCFTRSR